MKKFLILLCSLSIIGGFSLFEQIFIDKNFAELESKTSIMIEKSTNNTLKENELADTILWWHEKKKIMHIYIPHDAISEIDYYFAEALGYIQNDSFIHAKAKLTVVLDMAQSIPLTFKFMISNIF